MAAPGIEIAIQILKIQIDQARGLCAIDHRNDATRPSRTAQAASWHDQSGCRQDMADEKKPCARSHCGVYDLEDLFCVFG